MIKTDHFMNLQQFITNHSSAFKSCDKIIRIEDIDNPGWFLECDLKLLNISIETVNWQLVERYEQNWIGYKIEESIFYSAGGPFNLNEIIDNFLKVVQFSYKPNNKEEFENCGSNTLNKFLKWYNYICERNAYHEGIWGVRIHTITNPGWNVKINIEDTYLESSSFKPINIIRSDSDWIRCYYKDYDFIGECGINNLKEVLKIFLDCIGYRE